MNESEPGANDHHHYYDPQAEPAAAWQVWTTRTGWAAMICGALIAVGTALAIGDVERVTIVRLVVAAYAVTAIGLLLVGVGRHHDDTP